MQRKVALEEHFVIPSLVDTMGSSATWDPDEWRDIQDRIRDTDGTRLREMDETGIERMVLSLASNGIQEQVDTACAVRLAVEANDALAAIVAAHPDRYAGFAALPMQDPRAAADELERTVRDHGFKGALVNGYSNIGSLETAVYYDEAQYFPFWERLAALDVPLYLHPRAPLSNQRRIYQGRPELVAAAWGFAVETGTHALRLITSGLFDRYPNVTIVLGHLGEFLPFAIDRLERRLAHVRPSVTLDKLPSQYLRERFYVTTSGNFHTISLMGVIEQVGIDRVMFSVDYPFETMKTAAEWFDAVPISEADREKIGRTNAQRLLRL